MHAQKCGKIFNGIRSVDTQRSKRKYEKQIIDMINDVKNEKC